MWSISNFVFVDFVRFLFCVCVFSVSVLLMVDLPLNGKQILFVFVLQQVLDCIEKDGPVSLCSVIPEQIPPQQLRKPLLQRVFIHAKKSEIST